MCFLGGDRRCLVAGIGFCDCVLRFIRTHITTSSLYVIPMREMSKSFERLKTRSSLLLGPYPRPIWCGASSSRAHSRMGREEYSRGWICDGSSKLATARKHRPAYGWGTLHRIGRWMARRLDAL